MVVQTSMTIVVDKLKLTDETWAEFSSLEEAVYMPYSYIILKQNGPT